MTDKQIKVGDVVDWDKVPSGALVRDTVGDFAVRHGGGRNTNGSWVKVEGEAWIAFHGAWRWWIHDGQDPVTIIALDVPADATAEHLRTLAEVSEVREAVMRDASLWANEFTLEDLEDTVVTLHRAGWKPGMTAEDAARLVAEAG